ncbi:MAG: hypothetical protein ACI3Z5_07445 [Paludibacteraceae bacterium]|nr:hypothetical protein [Bacteroidales bacterium]
MKRFYALCGAILFTVCTFADSSIPTNINGVRLGVSSRKEVDKAFSEYGLKFSTETSDTTNFVYIGDCRHEEMDFDAIVTRYCMDTLVFLGFYGKCDSACTDYAKPFIQRMHAKYDNLQYPDSSMFYLMMTADADTLGFNKWGRTDEKSLVITMHNDTACVCIYFAESRLTEITTNTLLHILLTESNPNYAEENKVYGVAGVKFGDSRETVRNVISAKADKLLESDSHALNYYKVKIGGITYDYVTFYFTQGKGLISVNLQSSFYSWRNEEAKMFYENVISQYSRKYSNFKVITDEQNEKFAACGAFIDGYDYMPILITLTKSLSRGGDIMYYVQVDYYTDRKEGMYDDEI